MGFTLLYADQKSCWSIVVLIKTRADQESDWSEQQSEKPDAAFVNSSVTTGERVVTTRVGSIGLTPLIVHFKESFEKVRVVDDP